MSEEQIQTTEDSQLTKIIDKAYIGKEMVLLNGGKDNIVVIRGERTGSSANTLVLYNDAVQALQAMAPDTVKAEESPIAVDPSEEQQ